MSESNQPKFVPDAYPPDEVEPFSSHDLFVVLYKPYLIAELVLGGRERLARNLSNGIGIALLALLLLLASVIAPIPYGLFTPSGSFWKIAALYTGSMAICFPCLHIFTQFMGFRIDLARILGLALVITCVAGLFAFGFAPIIGFIYFSTDVSPDAQPSAR
jgi:hypothetical protein